jgi:hypothetical protein
LQTLEVVPERFAALAPRLPRGWPAVAESGVATAADARRMMRLGYRLALIGTALDGRDDPRRGCCGNIHCDTDSANLNGYTRRHVDQDLRHHQCRRGHAPPRPMSMRSASCLRPVPRQVTPGQAAQLAALAPPGILRIAVAQHPLQMKVDEICRILKPDYFQTDVEDLRELKIPAHIKVLPVVRFGRKTPNPLPARMLFEGPSSGIGELADWGRAAELARQTEVILAGGLSAQMSPKRSRRCGPSAST